MSQNNAIKNTVTYLPELKNAQIPHITKMPSMLSSMTYVGPGE